MTRDELLYVAPTGAKERHRLHGEVQRLRQKQDNMDILTAADNHSLSEMFKQLQDGVQRMEDRQQNPRCEWDDFQLTFNTVDKLHEHSTKKCVMTTEQDLRVN